MSSTTNISNKSKPLQQQQLNNNHSTVNKNNKKKNLTVNNENNNNNDKNNNNDNLVKEQLFEKLKSKDERNVAFIKKFDEFGTFTQFEGLTIVMPLLLFTTTITTQNNNTLDNNFDDTQNYFNEFFKELQKLTPKNVHALLPLESYHVTLSGLKCRSHFNTCDLYNDFVMKNIDNLIDFQKEIDQLFFVNDTNNTLKFTMEKPIENNDQLNQLTIHLKIYDKETENLIEKCSNFGKLKLKKLFRKSKFHLSLAYHLKNNLDLTVEEKREIIKCLNKYFYGKVLEFGRPEVCKFETMCCFEPVF